jgi:hypothetical protein
VEESACDVYKTFRSLCKGTVNRSGVLALFKQLQNGRQNNTDSEKYNRPVTSKTDPHMEQWLKR